MCEIRDDIKRLINMIISVRTGITKYVYRIDDLKKLIIPCRDKIIL